MDFAGPQVLSDTKWNTKKCVFHKQFQIVLGSSRGGHPSGCHKKNLVYMETYLIWFHFCVSVGLLKSFNFLFPMGSSFLIKV